MAKSRTTTSGKAKKGSPCTTADVTAARTSAEVADAGVVELKGTAA